VILHGIRNIKMPQDQVLPTADMPRQARYLELKKVNCEQPSQSTDATRGANPTNVRVYSYNASIVKIE
jgi:hypothetical protein